MPETQATAEKVRFDVFEVDFRAGELRRSGSRVKLQEQPFRVLSLLLEKAGEAVTREELRRRLWPADTFVDFNHGLNSAVARLREALGDAADNPRFIETVSKRGYRFIARLQTVEEDKTVSNRVPPASVEVSGAAKRPRRLWIGLSIGLALVGTVSIWALYRPKGDTQLTRLEVVPLTGLRGFQATPAFSPDGTLVAFRQSDGARNTGIYAAVVGGEKSIQLTKNAGDCCPTWSPDGQEIAFSRYSDQELSIFTVSALGGTERRVYRGASNAGGSGISWSPEADVVAFSEGDPGDRTRAWISELSLADSSVRRLTSPPPGSLDRAPVYSPDGGQMAFIRSTIAGVNNDVYVMAANGGSTKRLTFDDRPIMGPPAWTKDGREIIFSSNRGVATGLWRVSATGSEPRPVAGPVGTAEWPSIPAKGANALVYEQGISKTDIWQLELKEEKRHVKPPTHLIWEKGDKMRPDISPDGKKIAFESDRLGFWDIWTCDVSGDNCDQITSLHGTAGRARWSPNGRYLAFEFHPHERSEIYMVEVPGGVPRIFPTIDGADNLAPSWSRDGKWIYFGSKRGAEPFEVWKMPVGGGTPVQVTRHGGMSAVESPDGRYLYYCKYEQGGIWRIPLAGGEETEVVPEVGGGGWPNWAVSPEGIYFLRLGGSPDGSVEFLEFATGKTRRVWNFNRDPGWGISLSPDAKSLIYVQYEFAESNLMLVRNFR
jgi:Tol biopolymer transport system component/DNA-binding winged helix-turn-helix (wHTH) protein